MGKGIWKLDLIPKCPFCKTEIYPNQTTCKCGAKFELRKYNNQEEFDK